MRAMIESSTPLSTQVPDEKTEALHSQDTRASQATFRHCVKGRSGRCLEFNDLFYRMEIRMEKKDLPMKKQKTQLQRQSEREENNH